MLSKTRANRQAGLSNHDSLWHLMVAVLLFILPAISLAQPLPIVYRSSLFLNPAEAVYHYRGATRLHTSLKPMLLEEMPPHAHPDSLASSLLLPSPFVSHWKSGVWNRIFNTHLLTVSDTAFSLTIDPILDVRMGKESSDGKRNWQNTRGFLLQGSITNKLAFSSGFLENQTKFPSLYDSLVHSMGVVPGEGSFKYFKEEAFDYARSFGNLSYSPSTWFNLQLGYGKNFIGDGYRSLLLSEQSFNYPFLAATARFWRIQYRVMYAQFIDRSRINAPNLGYARNYGTIHYLDFALSPRWTVGLFEAVIWQASDSTAYRGVDWSYLNPIIFLRPAEFSVGSPDNALMGLNTRLIVGKSTTLYGQFLLDDFNLQEVRKNEGWWPNKYGIQAGVLMLNPIGIPGLTIRTEYNTVRPYTYSHYNAAVYGHYREPLAHPLGANFREGLVRMTYQYQRWFVHAFLNIYTTGLDSAGLNYGSNIFRNYNTHAFEYGNETGQGYQRKVIRFESVAGYLVNPVTNLNLSAGYIHRSETLGGVKHPAFSYVYLAFRMSLWQDPFDFL